MDEDIKAIVYLSLYKRKKKNKPVHNLTLFVCTYGWPQNGWLITGP